MGPDFGKSLENMTEKELRHERNKINLLLIKNEATFRDIQTLKRIEELIKYLNGFRIESISCYNKKE